MAIEWIKITDQKPKHCQDCITKMKHGVIQGEYDSKEGTFSHYYFGDITWYAQEWAPIEEAI